MFRWLAINIRTFLLAFVLALAVWVTAVTTADPNQTQIYPSPVPIEFIGQDPGLIITGKDIPQSVEVTLLAPRSVWQNLSSGESPVRAVVDLASLGAGTHTVQIQVQISTQPVRLISVTPTSFAITLEAQVTRSMPVKLTITGQPATGYQAGQPVLDPSFVSISGAQSIISRIDHIQATLDLSNARQNISQTLALQAVDASGTVVNGAAILPDKIQISLSVVQQGGYRDLAVKVVTNGVPASGYSLTSVSAFPPIVTVYSADTNTIESMPGFVETAPLDLSGATQDIQKQLAINLPPGVTLIGGQTVLVNVGVAPIQSSRTINFSPVEVIGAKTGVNVKVSPQTVDVILSGPLSVLDSLLFSDVHVQVDVTSLAPGTYQLTPKVTITNPSVAVESILPGTVEVVITGMGTPTP